MDPTKPNRVRGPAALPTQLQLAQRQQALGLLLEAAAAAKQACELAGMVPNEALAAVAGAAFKAGCEALFLTGRTNDQVLRLVRKGLPRNRASFNEAAAKALGELDRRIILPEEAH